MSSSIVCRRVGQFAARIIIPKVLAEALAVQDALRATTRIAGGCTSIEVDGLWVDGKGQLVPDASVMYEWAVFDAAKARTVRRMVGDIACLLLERGESAVMGGVGNMDNQPVPVLWSTIEEKHNA